MEPPIQVHIVVLLPVYTPVPLLLEVLPYSQAARALAKSERLKMPIRLTACTQKVSDHSELNDHCLIICRRVRLSVI